MRLLPFGGTFEELPVAVCIVRPCLSACCSSSERLCLNQRRRTDGDFNLKAHLFSLIQWRERHTTAETSLVSEAMKDAFGEVRNLISFRIHVDTNERAQVIWNS
jgi:hypothetical protein